MVFSLYKDERTKTIRPSEVTRLQMILLEAANSVEHL